MKTYLVIALIFSGLGGYLGYRLKKPEIKTVTVEKVVVDTKVKTVTKERILPSGEIRRETVSQSQSHSDTMSAFVPKKNWLVSASTTLDKKVSTIVVNRRILGELYFTISANNQGLYTAGFGAAF